MPSELTQGILETNELCFGEAPLTNNFIEVV